jgi:TRAP-type mannitol/chloroaromatic compound transport system permease small subunit
LAITTLAENEGGLICWLLKLVFMVGCLTRLVGFSQVAVALEVKLGTGFELAGAGQVWL